MILRKLIVALALAVPFVGANVVTQPVAAFHQDASHCYWQSNGTRSQWYRCPADASNPWWKVQARINCSNGSNVQGNTIQDYGDGLWRTSVATCPVGTTKVSWYLGLWYW